MSRRVPSGPTRRQVLAAGLALPATAWGFGTASKVDVGELDLGPGTLLRPNAWRRLLYDVANTTSVECEPRAVPVEAESPDLFEHPFLVLQGDDHFDLPSDTGIEQLSRYLAYGGFLFVDDTTGAEDSAFDASVRELVRRLFPTRPLGPLPGDHSVFRSFFLLRRPYGRVDRFDRLEGVTSGEVAPLVYCRNDLSGALDRRDDGLPRQACVPGGEGQRREAVKLGINLVLYSLTADYKKDQAHVRELMKLRRLE